MERALEGPAIGIDLGTTYSCVAVLRNGRVEVIQNEQGNRITPSCVAFTDMELLVGEAAINQISRNPKNSVIDAKRLIGRKFSDECVQSDMKLWPFEVVAGPRKSPLIKVTFKHEEKLYPAERISSMVLSKMKEIAESYLGTEVKNAVITVPARFNNSQRCATRDAGIIAGLNVLRIINEPTAAAFAYDFYQKNENTKNVLIFDAGGGTCDVSILTIDNGSFQVKATAGDTHLGGEDLDKRMMDYYVQEIKRKHGLDVSDDKRQLWRLKKSCESAKRLLSSAIYADIEIECIMGKDFDFSAKLTRAKFEELTMDLLEKFVEQVRICLEDAGMTKRDIDDVVLVGGSSRIPKLRELLVEFFEGKEFCIKDNVHPDEAVAYGAAVQAAILSGGLEGLTLGEVTPLSLGICTVNDVMKVMIPRNTPIPTRNELTYATVSDNQDEMRIDVYEGERSKASDNNLLGTFVLEGIPPAARGVGMMTVCYEVNDDGILTVTATEVTTGNDESLTITNIDGGLSKGEIEKMVEEANAHKEDDAKYRRAMEAKNSLDSCLYEAKKRFKRFQASSNVDADKLRRMEEAINKANQCVEGASRLEEEYFEMEHKLKKLVLHE